MTDSSDTRKNLSLRLRTAVNSPRNQRFFKWCGGVLVAVVLFGFFAAPPLLKSLLDKQLSQMLRRDVAVEQVKINPLALSASLSGLSVKAGDGKEVAGFDELYVNLSMTSLFKLAAVVDEIRLDGLRLAVTRLDEGRYDISDLLDEWLKPSEEPESGLPRFSLNNIQLLDGRITFDDQPRGKVHTISDIQIALPFVSSLPYQAEVLVQPLLSANVNGSAFKLSGQARPFAEAHESELDLALNGFDLASLQPYLPENLPIKLDSAKLDSQLKLVFKEVSEGMNSLLLLGGVQLSDMQLVERSGQPLLAWKKLSLDLTQADLLNRNIAVQRIALDGMALNLAVNGRGEFNLVQLAGQAAPGGSHDKAEKAAPAPGNPPEAPGQPLTWSLDEFVLSNALVRWQDASNRQPVNGEVRQLHARVGRLDHRLVEPIEIAEAGWQLDFGERLRQQQMTLKGVRVDLPGQRVDIAEVLNAGTRIAMLRNAAGEIEWLTPPALKASRPAGAKQQDTAGKKEQGWLAQVEKLGLDDLAVRFEDRSVKPAAVQEIAGLGLQAEKIGNVPKQKATLRIKAQVNQKGRMEMAGAIQVLPFDMALKLETSGIPLNSLQGYTNQFLNVELQRGLFSNQGEVLLRIDQGKLKAAYKGAATLGNLLAVDRENKADFLKWKSLHFAGIDFRLDPLAIDIREIALSDFFSRLILDANGQLNVSQIVRKPGSTMPSEAEMASAVPVPEKAVPAVQSDPVPMRIAKVTLNNGTVNFSDYFVKPNYSVNVARLGGRVSGLSSVEGTQADMELRGTYAGSAPVQIAAKLNPLAAKSYLDLKAEVKGVDLTDFSPYSGKYAGYLIDKGKLSLQVAYKLENRQLTAENQLFIDQLNFGAKVDSPDATDLPVNLAIALLRNNRGEIDLNLPISGSLDDPQFSIGGLVVKVIVNLFVKAVTSPFALLGSMFGGGEELSNVAFAAGRATLDDAGVKKLEVLAKALAERSSLKLEITGQVDPVADREGLKRLAIERAMQKEKLADLQKKGGDAESPDAISIAPEEYKTYLTRVYKAAKFPKPRNVVGMQKDLPVEEMEKLMLANIQATDEDLRLLARQRAERVQVWLIEQGKLAPERSFLVSAKTAQGDPVQGGRVDFSLR